MLKRLSILLLLKGTLCFAQRADTLTGRNLNGATIVGFQNKLAPGSNFVAIDSAQLAMSGGLSLSGLLQRNTMLFVKSYGPTGLASTSLRGAGASHTAVLWNGYVIQNPSLGQNDFALFPVFFMDEARLQYGTNGVRTGSGTLAGSVVLNNKQQFKPGFTVGINTQYTSFGDLSNGLTIASTGTKLSSVSRIYYRQGGNHFRYKETDTGKVLRQQHAAIQQYGLLQEFYYKPNAANKLILRYWGLYADRQLVGTVGTSKSSSTQQDEGHRVTLDGEHIRYNSTINYKTAFFNEKLIYADTSTGIFSTSIANTFIDELLLKQQLSPISVIEVGFNNTYLQGNSTGFSKKQYLDRASLFVAFNASLFSNSLHYYLGLRQEAYDLKLSPVIPYVGFEWSIWQYFVLKGNATRNYRFPTFNERYWTPGGNPNLKPEEGWSQELTAVIKLDKARDYANYSVTGFNRNINNWIIWLPGSSFWSPTNIMQVWSRGIEQRFSTKYTGTQYFAEMNAGYDFILSTNERAKSANDASVGKQIIYVPEQQAFLSFGLGYKVLALYYQHNYTGYRYIATDHSSYLEPYVLGNLQLAVNIKSNRLNSTVNIGINNVWDKRYEVVAKYPMPLRYYTIGLNLQFH